MRITRRSLSSPPEQSGGLSVAPKTGIFADLDEIIAAAPLAKTDADGWTTRLDTSPLLNDLDAKVKGAKRKKYFEDSLAQPPSGKQVSYLGYLLEHPGRARMLAFVRFANGYYVGRVTSGHFRQAIDMALRGRNDWGGAADLVRLSFDPEAGLELSPRRGPKSSPLEPQQAELF